MDKLRKIQKSYESDTDIRIETRKKNVLECEGSEGSEGSWENAFLSNSDKPAENLNNSGNNEEHTSASTQNTILKEPERQQAFLQDPSHPSHPSPYYKCYHPNCKFNTEDQEEYERHGALKHLE